MGTLVFVCPTTGHEVSTGVEVDRPSFKSLPRTKTAIFCPRCRKNHKLSVIWAWLAHEIREAPDESFVPSLLRRWFVPKRSSPAQELCRSRGAMLWRGTLFA